MRNQCWSTLLYLFCLLFFWTFCFYYSNSKVMLKAWYPQENWCYLESLALNIWFSRLQKLLSMIWVLIRGSIDRALLPPGLDPLCSTKQAQEILNQNKKNETSIFSHFEWELLKPTCSDCRNHLSLNTVITITVHIYFSWLWIRISWAYSKYMPIKPKWNFYVIYDT